MGRRRSELLVGLTSNLRPKEGCLSSRNGRQGAKLRRQRHGRRKRPNVVNYRDGTEKVYEKRGGNESDVELLLCTEFCDKRTILKKCLSVDS